MSNGRQIGTVVGSLVAAYFTAGASYAALATAVGGAAGGAIGGMFDDPTRTQGPRLEDLKVQFSTYGVGIPRIYGTERVGGNVIGSTDKLEIPWVTSSGKGGGETENTSYTYYVWMRLLLQETPRDGSTVSIVKFFQDGKLIWDASSGIPIGSALASAENLYASFVLYQGHGDQLPDAEEESFTGGPGSVSAYRGVVSVWMRAIECPGGRVPQFSFVLSTSATVGTEKLEIISTPSSDSTYYRSGGLITSPSEFIHFSSDLLPESSRALNSSLGGASYLTPLGRWPFPSVFTGPSNLIPVSGADAFLQLAVATAADSAPRVFTVYWVDARTGARNVNSAFIPIETIYGFSWAAFDAVSGDTILVPIVASPDPSFRVNGVAVPKPPRGFGPVAAHGRNIYMMSSSGDYLTWMDSTGLVLAEIPTFMPSLGSSGIVLVNANAGGVWIMGIDPTNNVSRILKMTPATGAITVLTTDAAIPSGTQLRYVTFYADDEMAVIGPTLVGPNFKYHMLRFNAVSIVPVKVKDIIAAECELAGVTTYDVSGIPDSDTVIGYKLANPASARANIEPLLTLIGGYVVDEDNVTKFKKFADITSVATVTFDELGQAEGDASGEAMPLNRTQEIDLPRSVTTSYINPTSDYQTASETEVRQVTDATEDAQVQLPICVTSDQAKKVSQMVLYDRWRRQNTRSTTVSRKYAYVSPGDGAIIEYPRGTWKLWLALSTNDTGALCEWSLCPGDAAIFTQTAVGATGYVSQQVAPLPAPTRAQFLDMPIVRDADNNAGLYVALDSYAPEPASGELLVGDDDISSNMTTVGAVSQSAPIGFAETVLGAWTPNVVDEANLITINLGDDVFNSCTRDVLLSGGGEYWAYGAPGRWEIGASAQGSSLGSGRYTLSRHLRGLFGTEQFTGTHAVGDSFVLLRIVGLLRPNLSVGEIGQTKFYRPVTKGRSRDSVSSQTYANTGEGLRPLSPVNLRRSNTNDLSVDRRSRLAMNNLTGALPLGEATEAYSWSFYTSGAFTTLIGSAVTTSSTITAAQITALGATPSATLFVRVSQLSDSVGLGHELQATA